MNNKAKKISVDEELPRQNHLVLVEDSQGNQVQALFQGSMWLFPNGGTGNEIEFWYKTIE